MEEFSPVALLGEFIRIPSVNPEGEPGVEEPGEARLAARLKTLLSGLGAEVSLRKSFPGARTLLPSSRLTGPENPACFLLPTPIPSA